MTTIDLLPQKLDRHLTTLMRERISRYRVMPIRGRQTSHGVVLLQESTVISRISDGVSTISPHLSLRCQTTPSL
jgi:hypothetical protein